MGESGYQWNIIITALFITHDHPFLLGFDAVAAHGLFDKGPWVGFRWPVCIDLATDEIIDSL